MSSAAKPKLLVAELWGIGDLAIATPFLRAAAEHFEVTLLAKPHALELQPRFWPEMRVIPFVAPWTAFRSKYKFWRWPWREMFNLRQKLRKENFAFALSARPDPRDHFLLKIFGAEKRLGFPRIGSGIFLTHPLANPKPMAHRYEFWRVAAKQIGIELPPREQIPLPPRKSGNLVLVHSGARLPARVWPLENYRALVRRLRENNFAVQVVCDPDQQNWWQQSGENKVAGPRTLTDLISLIDQAAIFIGNCSGPGHLAAISGVPTFTFFGPSLPEWFAPLHPQAEWLEDKSCPYKPCEDYCRFPTPRCLENISVESAWLRVKAFVQPHLSGQPLNHVRTRRPIKLALTILAENPSRKTGLTTLFHELVSRSLKIFPDVSWLVFAGPNQEWTITDSRVKVVRDFPANDRLSRRLFADHFQVPAAARAHDADALITIGFVPFRRCLPTVMHVLSLQSLNKQNRLGLLREIYRNSMVKHSWPRADLVITNSRWAEKQILSLHPQFHNRIVVSYEGVQHEIFHPVADQREMNLLKEKFNVEPGYFLWISNFYPYKQAELLLAGYARLDAETRQRHPLVMAGGNWLGGLDMARAATKLLGIEQNVRFFGWVDDAMLAPLYRHARAFCLASREETFGRCVIEAMACGIPAVVNDIPVMREVTAGHALIVNYRDADAVAKALQSLVADEYLAARLRVAGIARAKDFTFEKLAAERLAAIQRLVENSQP